MCGILGSTHTSQESLSRAAPCIAYRGPDATGFFMDGSFGMAHHRLSIIDIDARSSQPMVDTETGITISYNGEIYNFEELRASLISSYSYQTASDTEVLLHAYREMGTDFFPKLRGMFALAIYDPRDMSVVLARDHAGIKPLYWSNVSDTLRFSSEVKGIAALMRESGTTPSIDHTAVSLALQYGYIPPPLTLIEGVSSIRPGTCLIWDLETKTVRNVREWQPEVSPMTLPQALRDAVSEHLVSDVPVGLFFSGGIDSSLILRELQACGAPLQTFTLQQAGKDVDVVAAREIASLLELPSPTEVVLTADSFAEAYTRVMDRIDEPLADTSIFPTTLLALRAAKDVKVVLSGEGGDELFYGYERQRVLSAMTHMDSDVTLLDRLYLSMPHFPGKNRLFLYAYRILKQPISYYLLLLSPTQRLQDLRAFALAKRHAATATTIPEHMDRTLYLEGNLLRKLDMATSYASIEGRVPLLDPRLYAISDVLVPKQQFDSSGGKRQLRSLLMEKLPASLVNRPKSGFGMWRAPFIAEHVPYQEDVARGVALLHTLGHTVPDAAILLRLQPRFALLVATIVRAYENIGISYEAT